MRCGVLERDMKICVSGASAHLGRAVVLELLKRSGGHDDSATTTDPKVLRRPTEEPALGAS
jgi:uncharacterized protein YbjT (DUF2867 family)